MRNVEREGEGKGKNESKRISPIVIFKLEEALKFPVWDFVRMQ